MKVFSSDFTKPKYDIEDFTKNSYTSFFADETRRLFKSVPLEDQHRGAGEPMFPDAILG